MSNLEGTVILFKETIRDNLYALIKKTAEVVYIDKLNQTFINSIAENVWFEESCEYPNVKEDVVCKRNHKKTGDRLPKVKVKTEWWLNEVKKKYPNSWEELV